MFETNQDTLQTPARPPPATPDDLLISFDTPSQNPTTTEIPVTTRKTLIYFDGGELLGSKSSHNALAEFISSSLETERSKWIHEVEMRHAAEMQTLAADLHTQYREKHTRKVDALKITYKRQYEKTIVRLE